MPTREKSRRYALVMLFLVNVLWGLSFIASKYALTHGFMPMTLAFWRYAVACLVLVPLCLWKEGMPKLARRDILPLVLSALFGITFYYYFEYTGMTYTTASTASLLIATIPIFTLVFTALVHRVFPGKVRALCALVSLLGVFLIIRFGAGGNEGGGTLKGNLLILCCCVCWVLYIEVCGRLRGRLPSLSLTACQAVIALVTMLPLALREGNLLPEAPPLAWACMAGLGVLCSAFCYYFYVEALGILDAYTVSLFINVNPIAAVLGGFLLLGERMSPVQLLGGAIILVSLMVANRGTRGKPVPKTAAPADGEATRGT